MLSTVMKGLLAGVLYQVEVAAVTSAGVGIHSHPVPVFISEWLLQPKIQFLHITANIFLYDFIYRDVIATVLCPLKKRV